MNAGQFISAAILKATGQVYTGTFGDDDSTKMLALGNFCILLWRDEPSVDWASLYDPGVDISTVSATDTFDLDDSIYKISNQPGDFIKITHVDGTITNYQTVEPKRLKQYPSGNFCAKVGSELVFNKPFTASSPEFGGTITVPCYVSPDPLVKTGDAVPVDNPNWLVLMAAAEWVSSDTTLAQNYPNILAQANDAMSGMKQSNQAQVETVQHSPVARGMEW